MGILSGKSSGAAHDDFSAPFVPFQDRSWAYSKFLGERPWGRRSDPVRDLRMSQRHISLVMEQCLGTHAPT
jgi:hypothetical protein